MPAAAQVVMASYQRSVFRAPLANGHPVSHDLYIKGVGPVVVIIQELPGIGPQTLRLADKFADAGFKVVLPHLFGPLGKVSMLGNTLRVLCMRREFRIMEQHQSSPIVDWLRALCRDLKNKEGVDGVAVVGMCLTGNFAVSLMADDSVLAGVASQPSLPIGKQAPLHMDEHEITAVKQRLDTQGPMLAYRFAGDKLCQADKFCSYEKTFNSGKERIRLKTLPGKGHSVLTLDFVNEVGHPTRQAFEEVLDYFRTKLQSI